MMTIIDSNNQLNDNIFGATTRAVGGVGGPVGKGQIQTGSALMGSLRLLLFLDRGTFWVLPLTNF